MLSFLFTLASSSLPPPFLAKQIHFTSPFAFRSSTLLLSSFTFHFCFRPFSVPPLVFIHLREAPFPSHLPQLSDAPSSEAPFPSRPPQLSFALSTPLSILLLCPNWFNEAEHPHIPLLWRRNLPFLLVQKSWRRRP